MIGEVVNYRYEIMEKIGEGAIFSVYKARDKMLNRLVALKMLKDDLQQNKNFADSLCAGYRAASSLNHPNIARVLDADNGASGCFVVCEYVRGVSVKDRVTRGGALAVPLALDISVPVLQAMEYAHTSGMFHGNLRSQDVIVSPDGEVKVTDFGLANALAASPEIANTYVMRSVHYEAPEISEEGAISAASDVYSLGVILYEMLTGNLPYTGNTAVAVAIKRMKEPPIAPRLHNTGVPKSLSDLILKAIEVAPGSRFKDVSSMLAEVLAVREGIRVGRPTVAPAPTPKRTADEDEEQDEYVRPERSVALRLTGLVLLFVAVVVVTLFATLRIKNPPPAAIKVPKLLGLTIAQANTEAARLGFRIQQDGTGASEVYPEGQICVQNPLEDETVPRSNPVVHVTISAGSGEAQVPNVVGLTEGEANSLITRDGFALGPPKQKSDETVPVSCVISQEPPAGSRVPPQTTVTLTLSTGPKAISEEPTPTPAQDDTDLKEQAFNVKVKVPETASEAQQVRVVVSDQVADDQVAYDEPHEPGDSFSVRVTGKGSPVRIKVFVGEELVGDNTY